MKHLHLTAPGHIFAFHKSNESRPIDSLSTSGGGGGGGVFNLSYLSVARLCILVPLNPPAQFSRNGGACHFYPPCNVAWPADRLCVRDSSHSVRKDSISDPNPPPPFFFFPCSIYFRVPSGLHLIAQSSCTVAAAVLSTRWTDLLWQWLCHKKKREKEGEVQSVHTHAHTNACTYNTHTHGGNSFQLCRAARWSLFGLGYTFCLTHLELQECNRPPGQCKNPIFRVPTQPPSTLSPFLNCSA